MTRLSAEGRRRRAGARRSICGRTSPAASLRWRAPEGRWTARRRRPPQTVPTVARPDEPAVRPQCTSRSSSSDSRTAFPARAGKGLNFFFSDELDFGVGGNLWTAGSPRSSASARATTSCRSCRRCSRTSARARPKVRLDYTRRDGGAGGGGLLPAGLRLAPAARHDLRLRPRRPRPGRRRVRRLLPHAALEPGPGLRPAGPGPRPHQEQGRQLHRPSLPAAARLARGLSRQRLGHDHRRSSPTPRFANFAHGPEPAHPPRPLLLDARRLVGMGAALQPLPHALLAAHGRVPRLRRSA